MSRTLVCSALIATAVLAVFAAPAAAKPRAGVLTEAEARRYIDNRYSGYEDREAGTALARRVTDHPIMTATAYAESAQRIGRRAAVVRVRVLIADGTLVGYSLTRDMLVREQRDGTMVGYLLDELSPVTA